MEVFSFSSRLLIEPSDRYDSIAPYDDFVQEFAACCRKAFFELHSQRFPVEVEVLRSSEDYGILDHILLKELPIMTKAKLTKNAFILRFGCVVDMDAADALFAADPLFTPADYYREVYERTATLFVTHVLQLVFASQIAKPFYLVVKYGDLRAIKFAADVLPSVDENIGSDYWLPIDPITSSVANSLLGHSGWPSIQLLPIQSVWEWMTKLNRDVAGAYTQKAGIALTVLSRILMGHARQYDLGGNLLWASMGLEALYCDGHDDITKQINTNTRLLLGEPPAAENRFIRLMYDYRSKLVHGSRPLPLYHDVWRQQFPFHYLSSGEGEKGNKGIARLYEAEFFAIRTLLASIQRLIYNEWTSLDFSTAVHMTGS